MFCVVPCSETCSVLCRAFVRLLVAEEKGAGARDSILSVYFIRVPYLPVRVPYSVMGKTGRGGRWVRVGRRGGRGLRVTGRGGCRFG